MPIRHPSHKSSVDTSFETDILIHRKYNKIPGTYVRGILMPVACGLFSWSMAGLLAFSSRQFALTSNQKQTFVRFTLLFFLPEQAQRAAYAARGSKRLVHITTPGFLLQQLYLSLLLTNTWPGMRGAASGPR